MRAIRDANASVSIRRGSRSIAIKPNVAGNDCVARGISARNLDTIRGTVDEAHRLNRAVNVL